MVKLVTAWVLVLLAIIFGAKWLWPEDAVNPQSAVQKTVGKQEVPPEDLLLLNDAIPACSQTFSAFLTSGTPEERNQYLLNPMDTAARMSRFYTLNPLVNIDPAKLSLIANAVLHLPNDRAIETQWKSSDGRLFDAVFVKQKGEWLLDWDYYIRYSDYPWALFLAGSGGETGEFRLLARERLADERKNADSISIVLYAPRFGDSNSTGFASPEFLIPRESKNGRLLEAAFKLEKSGKRSFGVSLPGLDPEGHIRVRVKVRRSGELTEHRYELEDVVACHWYSVDAPGVEISAPSSSR